MHLEQKTNVPLLTGIARLPQRVVARWIIGVLEMQSIRYRKWKPELHQYKIRQFTFDSCTGGCGGGPRFVRRLLSVTGTWLILLLLLFTMALLLLVLLLLRFFCFLSVSLAASSSAKSTAPPLPPPPPPPPPIRLLPLIVFSGDGDLLLIVDDCAVVVPPAEGKGIQ